MENFFYDGEFFGELDEFIDHITDNGDEEEVYSLPDNFTAKCYESVLEKPVILSAEWIFDRIPEHRFPLDSEAGETDICEALKLIDFTAANEKLPSLYYQTKKPFFITKADLLEYIK